MGSWVPLDEPIAAALAPPCRAMQQVWHRIRTQAGKRISCGRFGFISRRPLIGTIATRYRGVPF